MISKKQLHQLKQYFQHQPVDVVYLFGSQATGKTTKLSDVDLGILFKKGLSGSERFDLRLGMISRACGILKKERVDVVDLEGVPLKFRYQVVLPKVVVIVKDKPRMIEMERLTVKRYLDFRPYLYSIAQRQLELIAEGGFRDQKR